MKDISNLDIKRHRLGFAKELSMLAIVGVYKTATMKTKLELIGLIEVLKHTEKNYSEALNLIFKLEKVSDVSGLITKLSKNHLDFKVLSSVKRMEMAPKPTKKADSSPVSSKDELSYFQKNKISILVVFAFVGMFLFFLISHDPSQTTQSETNYKKETYVTLSHKLGHKFVYTSINGIPTTFMLDTGASTSTVSKSYLNKHKISGFVNRRTHFMGYANYITANGETVNAEVWQFPSITIGPKTIYNVEIAVMEGIDDDGFLLGMSTINKLGRTTIDLTNNKIIVN